MYAALTQLQGSSSLEPPTFKMKTATMLSIAAVACLATGCAHAQPASSGARVMGSETVEIPQPPATAYVSLETVLRMPVPGKPVVVGVERGSPAAAAGFQVGDTLDLFDGRDPVAGRVNLRRLTPGTEYSVTVRRGGETRTLTLVPGAPRREN